MDRRVPVHCSGNENTKYDGNVWMERLLDIVELNGTIVSSTEPLSLSSLNNGDRVKVCQALKNGRKHFLTNLRRVKRRSSDSSRTLKPSLPAMRRSPRQSEKPVSREYFYRQYFELLVHSASIMRSLCHSLCSAHALRVRAYLPKSCYTRIDFVPHHNSAT